MSDKKSKAVAPTDQLLKTLQQRFEKNMHRHANIQWADVETRLKKAPPQKLAALEQMEATGGEPDVVCFDKNDTGIKFYDCAAESPKGRRSLCYDRAALNSRKEFKPANSAADLAEEMGIALLTEEEYRKLQQLEAFDLKTSSWVFTPAAIRKLGGAIFCDRRYDTVFTYHNGAESYYAARGFRGCLQL